MATNEPYFTNAAPAYDLYDDAGAVIPAVRVLMSHTGTVDTTGGGNGDTARTTTQGGYEVALGADTSAAAINPYLDPTLDPANLPTGTVAAPIYDGPIY